MGKIFRARVKDTQQKVAIKSLHKVRQSDQRAVAQFVKEAQLLTRLHHDNIVRVEGLGRFPGGGYFMVMDYVEGIDLQSQLDVQPFSIEAALGIFKKVTDAIGYAHDKGIIHCDLKPGNILQDKKGHVLVTDFGFAFLIADGATVENSIGGTAGFIAPEIMSRQSLPTPATDIYSLGVLLWTLITGRLPEKPFTHGRGKKELKSVHSVVKRCLSPDPRKRYQTIPELQQALMALE